MGLATLSSGWQNPGGEGGIFLYVDLYVERDADITVVWEAPGRMSEIVEVTRRFSRAPAGAGVPARSEVRGAPPPLCPQCV